MLDNQSLFAAGGCAESDQIARIGKLTMTASPRTNELVFESPCGRGQVRMYIPAGLTPQQRADMFDQLARIERESAAKQA